MQPTTFISEGAPPRRPRLPAPALATRLRIQANVIAALMIRYIMAKYGRGNLGFLWLIIEPIFLLAGVILIWTYLHPNRGHGVSIAAFVISGYGPLTLWRHLLAAQRVMSMSAGLLYHRRITVFDIIIARTLTEIASVGAAGLIVYFMLLSVGAIPWVENPRLVLAGWLLMCWFGFGVSCIVAGLSEKSEVVENLIQPIQYLMLPISGVFFMVSWLPASVRPYITLVPQVNIFELIRDGFFGVYADTYYSISYIVVWASISSLIGLSLLNSARKNLSV